MEPLENLDILSPEKCTHSTQKKIGSLSSSQSPDWPVEPRRRNTAMGPQKVTDKGQKRRCEDKEKEVRVALLKYHFGNRIQDRLKEDHQLKE